VKTVHVVIVTTVHHAIEATELIVAKEAIEVTENANQNAALAAI
jgi:hypothetical protein